MKTKMFLSFAAVCTVLSLALSGCGPGVTFSAPEIDPPDDLIPSAVPEGFELIKGFRIQVDTFARFLAVEADGEARRVVCDLDVPDAFFALKSPAGYPILGVHYQDGEVLLLISKSYFPGGSLAQWRSSNEAGQAQAEPCECCCVQLSAGFETLLRGAALQEMITIDGAEAAVVEGHTGTILLFMRGDDLIAVEGGLSRQELREIAADLLKK